MEVTEAWLVKWWLLVLKILGQVSDKDTIKKSKWLW